MFQRPALQWFRLWLFALAQLAGATLSAQETPHIRHFTPADYRAQNQNWSLAQSPEGWIYAGNNEGLLEFDGTGWRNFAPGLTVRSVAVGQGGGIYAGSFEEFGLFNPTPHLGLAYHGNLSSLMAASNLAKEEIWHILPHGNAVYAQSFSTIYKYDYQQVTTIKPASSIMFLQAVDGRLLFQAIGGGLFELMPDDNIRLLPGTEGLAGKIVQFIVSDGADGCLVGTSNDGIFLFKNNQLQAWPHPLNATFKKVQLNRALRLADGSLALGTILDGVYILDKDARLAGRFNRRNGLQNNTVLAMLEDRDHNLWLGLDRGIDFLELNAPLRFYRDLDGKTGATYTAALFQNQLYIGANQGVFVKDFSPNSTFQPSSTFQLVEGTQGQVWELKVLNDRLFCGHNDGSFLLENRRARKISNQTGGWQILEVPGLPGHWVQATYTGLALFRANAAGEPVFWKRADGLVEPLRSIAFDAAGYLWAAHPNRGLFRLRLDFRAGQVVETKQFSTSNGLPTDQHLTLVKIGGQIFLNSGAGVLALRLLPGGQVTFERDSFFAPQRLVLPGWGDTFWTIGDAGLSLFSGRSSRAAAQAMGEVALVRGFENVVALDSTRSLFCLDNGYALLDGQISGATLPKKSPHPPVIREVWVAGRQISLPLPVEILELGAAENSPLFRFAEATFGQTPHFAWRLEGLPGAETWSNEQPVAEKEFSNLPPGRYVFRLRSRQSGLEIALVFRVEAPWYRRGWAWACYAGLLLGGLFLLEKYNLRRLARQRNTLETERERQLARQRSENEREILSLEIENKNREISNAALSAVRKNEMLQKIRDELRAAKNDPAATEKIIRAIDQHIEGDHDWAVFEESFNAVHDDFFKRLMLQFPDLTPGDLRLCAYLKMNFSSKEIAPLLNISVRGVENKRYRLRKKMGLPEETNLTEFVMAF